MTNKEKCRLYYQKNIDKERNRKKKYYHDNKEIINKKTTIRVRNKYNTDPLFRLKCIYRSRLKDVLINKHKFKSLEVLGCSWQQFKDHIESLFTAGMSWEKVGKEIHIDHIIPLALASTEEDLIILSTYVNLRPCWAKDNLKKGKKTKI